jgi:small-conductance mechanosensitive channel
LVPPGAYTMKLTVDGKSESAAVNVKMDPRVHLLQADLESLYTAQTKMAESLDAVAKADLEVHSVMEQAEADHDQAIAAQLSSFNAALKIIMDGAKSDATKPLPGIDEVTAEAAQLYGEFERADANPTAALLAAASHVRAEAKEVLGGWQDFKRNQLPELNRQLEREHHPAIQPSRQPTNMPQEGDED